MVAGYVDGRYRWSDADWARFPYAVKVGIAVYASTDNGQVLDVETGDATPAQAPFWVRARRAAGVDPVVYVNRANIDAVRQACVTAGIAPPAFWLSTLDGSRPWGAGIVAIQYAGAGLSGGHYDLSDVSDQWPGLPPAEETTAMLIISTGTAAKWLLTESALVDIPDAQTLQGLTDAGVKTATVTPPFLDALRGHRSGL